MTTPTGTQSDPHAALGTLPEQQAAAAPVRADQIRAVLADRERPPRPGPLATSLTFAWRALLKIKHVPEQLFDVTLTPVMFTVLMTYMFGGAIAGSPREYLQFLLPGILVMSVVFTTIYSGFTLNTDLTKGVFDRFRSLPIWQPSTLAGSLLGDLIRYATAATIALAVGLALGYRPSGGAPGVIAAVLVVIAFSSSLSWVFMTFGLLMRSPNAVMGIGWTVLFPFTFVSNAFVQTQTLPGWLQAIADNNPLTHLITAARSLMDGAADGGEIAWVLIAAVCVTAVFAPLAMHLYRRKT